MLNQLLFPILLGLTPSLASICESSELPHIGHADKAEYSVMLAFESTPEARPLVNLADTLPVDDAPDLSLPLLRSAEVMPSFPCSTLSSLDRKAASAAENQEFSACGEREMLNFLSQNIRYPEESRKDSVQGRVIIQFVVETDGSRSGIRALRAPTPELGKEAERVIELMPRWQPGYQAGVLARVQFNLPIVFRLE